MGDETPDDSDGAYCSDQYCRAVQEAISALIKMRLNRETAGAIEANEGRLLASLAALQMLCSDLRETRVVVPFPRERVN